MGYKSACSKQNQQAVPLDLTSYGPVMKYLQARNARPIPTKRSSGIYDTLARSATFKTFSTIETNPDSKCLIARTVMRTRGGLEIVSEPSRNQFGNEQLLPWYVVGVAALVCGVALLAISLLGPLWLESIQYRTSQSGIWQTEGGDLVNLILMVPLLLIGGVLQMLRRDGAKYFLVLTPLTLMYVGLSLGLGQEWGNPEYTGNVENYAWLYLVIIIGGLLLLISTLSMFRPEDAPEFKPRGLKIYVAVMALFLLLFALMWMSELVEVISTGNTSSGSYEETPVVWWLVRYFDLGITIPLGFVALYLLLTKPRRAYAMVLLFFGFFVTLGSGVLAMALVMIANDDPTMQATALPVFGALAALAWGGLLFLLKDRLRGLFRR